MVDEDQLAGSLIGLAVGDAVGTTLEFKSPGSFTPITDMIGGGPFNLKPGQWTDDTSMALCLAESLITKGTFHPVDQLERYVRWWKEGHLSSTGTCFDIGGTTRHALLRFEKTGEPYCGPIDPRSAGNGSIMRLAPVVICFHLSPDMAIKYAGESSRTTHGARACIDGCRYLASLLLGAFEGFNKDRILDHPDPRLGELCPEILNVAKGSFKQKQPPDIRGTGYVVDSLEAALWAFYNSDSFEEGLLKAVNLGDDADTTGAVYGQISGAYYGKSGIPERWIKRMAHRELIEKMASDLDQGYYFVTRWENTGVLSRDELYDFSSQQMKVHWVLATLCPYCRYEWKGWYDRQPEDWDIKLPPCPRCGRQLVPLDDIHHARRFRRESGRWVKECRCGCGKTWPLYFDVIPPNEYPIVPGTEYLYEECPECRARQDKVVLGLYGKHVKPKGSMWVVECECSRCSRHHFIELEKKPNPEKFWQEYLGSLCPECENKD